MSKALPDNNKTSDDVMTMTFYDVILYFKLHLGRKCRKLQHFCFLSDLLEIWYRG